VIGGSTRGPAERAALVAPVCDRRDSPVGDWRYGVGGDVSGHPWRRSVTGGIRQSETGATGRAATSAVARGAGL